VLDSAPAPANPDAASESATDPRPELKLRRAANGWGYRPQLDGLRAVAVYLVVAFHAGSWRLQGGFIGVDLFFVLSGFLVTNVILTDLADEGHLRLRRFYARRVRRLIPAAAITVVGTAIAAVLISNPLDRSSWTGDSTAASLWYANWHFIREANDYFLSDDATSPYQHFWSLSIEEQFYLAFPALLIALWVVLRRNLTAITAAASVLLAVGVGLQLYWADRDPNRAYLGTDTRAYQLLVGVVLALVVWQWLLPKVVQRAASWSALLSLCAFLVVSSVWLDVSASTRGLVAAIAAGWCVASVQAARSGPVVWLLSWKPVRYLGQISYGTYLWHWPIVVFTLQLVDPGAEALFIISATLGTALAALSHELVERPARLAARLNSTPVAVIAGGVVLAVVSGLLIAPALLQSDRTPSIAPRLSTGGVAADSNVQRVPDDIDWEAARLAPAGAPKCERPDGADCIIVEGSRGTMLLIGDSHARMLMPTFEYIAEQHDLELAVAYSTSCPWMESSLPKGDTVGKDRCIDQRRVLYGGQLERLDPDIVILAGYPYSIYPDGLESTDSDLAGVAMPEVLQRQVDNSTRRLSADGRWLVFVEPIPIFASDPLTCLSGADTADACTFAPMLSTQEEQLYRDAANASDSVASIDLDPLACPRLPICDPLQRNSPVWRDTNHFSTEFAEFLGPRVNTQLTELGVFDELADLD
jgi:peptidoglycan/LPS O-acetylase OafA/YrhL